MNFPNYALWLTLLLFATKISAQDKLLTQQLEDINSSSIDVVNLSTFNHNLSASISFDGDLLIATRNDIFENDEFVFRDSTEYQYDENENQISINTLRWDGISWNNNFRILIEYDSNGNNTYRHGQQYQNGEWINSSETYYEYNNQDNITLSRTRSWSDKMWVDKSRTNFTYDQNNQLIERLYLHPVNGEWYNSGRDFISYNNNGEISEQAFEIWLNNEWLPREVTIFIYDANGNLIEKELKRWALVDLKPQKKTSYEYDNAENLVTIINQEVIDGAYENISKRDFTYNSQNIINTAIYSIWSEFNVIGYNWMFTDSYDYSVDDRENVIYYIHKEWTQSNLNWENASQGFNYFQFASSTEDYFNKNLNFTISPNPSNGNFDLNFDLSQTGESHIKIYTLDGRLLEKSTISRGTQITSIDLGHLKNGEYILSITSNEGSGSQKIIIAK